MLSSDGDHQVGLVDLALWGKSRGLDVPYPVVCHLLDAAAIAEELWGSYVPHALRRVISRALGVGEQEFPQVIGPVKARRELAQAADSQQQQVHGPSALTVCR
jgi:CRISPR-associated endonuclease/helicase Cas3